MTAVIRLDGRRLEAQADDGPDAAAFAEALAGERPVLSGHDVPVTGRPDLAVRHVAGRLVVDVFGPVGAADPVSTVANHLRRAVVRGAQPLGARMRRPCSPGSSSATTGHSPRRRPTTSEPRG